MYTPRRAFHARVSPKPQLLLIVEFTTPLLRLRPDTAPFTLTMSPLLFLTTVWETRNTMCRGEQQGKANKAGNLPDGGIVGNVQVQIVQCQPMPNLQQNFCETW